MVSCHVQHYPWKVMWKFHGRFDGCFMLAFRVLVLHCHQKKEMRNRWNQRPHDTKLFFAKRSPLTMWKSSLALVVFRVKRCWGIGVFQEILRGCVRISSMRDDFHGPPKPTCLDVFNGIQPGFSVAKTFIFRGLGTHGFPIDWYKQTPKNENLEAQKPPRSEETKKKHKCFKCYVLTLCDEVFQRQASVY